MPCGCGQVMKVVHHTAVWETWKASYVKVKVAKSCLTLCDPMDYTVHGILQARILEWLAIPSPRDLPNPGLPHFRWLLYQLSHKGNPRILKWAGYSFSSRSFQPRNWTRVSCIAGGFFTKWVESMNKWMDKRQNKWMGKWASEWLSTPLIDRGR